MIPGCADALITLHQQGFNILVSTIDLSASCIPFDEVTKILPYATDINKCTAVCTECGEDANYTYRKFDNSDVGEISVGGFDKYEPRCQKHHPYFF
jgi:thymidine kinase